MRIRAYAVVLTLVIAALLAAGAVGGWWYIFYNPPPRTHVVAAGDVLEGVVVSGSLWCRQKAEITSEVAAAVKAILVTEGRQVAEGQTLIELDSAVIDSERAKAAAQLELAQHRLAELQAGPRKEEITQAREAVNRANSELAYEEAELKRIQQALQANAASQSEADMVESRVRKAQAERASAKARLALLESGTRPEQVDAGKAEVNLAEAELKRTEALRRRFVLHAPHAGVITVTRIHRGEVVAPGMVLLRVENIRSIEVRAQVQESQLQGVAIGSPARVLTDAYPNQPIEATVEQILPRVDPEQGTVTVLLKAAQPEGLTLMDGMAADIAVIRSERKNVLRLPSEAVRRSGGKAWAQVRQEGRFVERTLELGISDGKWTEVKAGLAGGDVVRMP